MKILKPIVTLLIFWLLFFFLQQLLFIAIDCANYKGNFSDFLSSMLLGFRMNLAGTAYLVGIPVIMLIAGIWGLKPKVVSAVIKWETIVLLFIACLLGAIDLGIYKAWGTKFNAKALAYMAYPKEVLPLVFAKETLYLLLVLALEFGCFLWLRNKIVKDFEELKLAWPYKLSASILLVFFFIIGARGGFQKLPLNRNQVFKSEHQLLNYAAMNSVWNLGELLSHPIEPTQNPYPFYSSEEAKKLFNELIATKKDTTERILATANPNIVLIFLESWTADVVECLGGEKGVSPKYCELTKEGLLFDQFYSTGYRTEQGLLAMLSAFPAQPQGSVIYSWGKFDKLPNLFTELKGHGFSTSFYYGGRLQFDNVEAYLRSAGVEKMVGENDFAINKRTVWGAYDEEIFNLHLKELKTMRKPFFSVLGTISTHEWWDSKVNQLFHHPDEDELNDKYRNTVHYSDSCLFDYIQRSKKEDWYKNTLFILVADHGCKFPLQRNNFEKGRHHIPMLLLGGALKPELQGKINSRIASHTDLAATLFAQLNIKSNNFPRSHNLFNPYSPEYAYYAFDNGFGLITKDKTVIYDNYQNKDLYNSIQDAQTESMIRHGKAYLQCTNSFVVGAGK